MQDDYDLTRAAIARQMVQHPKQMWQKNRRDGKNPFNGLFGAFTVKAHTAEATAITSVHAISDISYLLRISEPRGVYGI